MKMENPWIAAQCGSHDVAPNTLPTFLQEQYGQLGEDLILEAILKSHFARQGLPLSAIRYLEVGANHPIQTSNTYLFSRKWQGRGVLVEANPGLVKALIKVRPGDSVLNFAVVPLGYPPRVAINIASHSELSSLDAQHVRSFGSIGTLEGSVEVESVTLDELLQACFPDGLHLMSIDIEGLDLDVLRTSTLVRRPTFIITEPSRHYQADAEQAFGQAMKAKGYVEVARTEYNLVFEDASARVGAAPAPVPTSVSPSLRRVLRTFDIFDTLIARDCIRAEPLFLELERRVGIEGLARARYEAEREVEATEYTLTDIYAAVARRLALAPQQAEEIAGIELQLELENVVPIRDNLALLDADSVLITDMYLPVAAISALLERAGLTQDLPIVRSSHGKRRGQVWGEFAAQGVRCIHRGDNPQSDVAVAAGYGMRATLSTLAEPTPVEKHLYANGFPALARAIRSARLMTSSQGLPDWLYRLQTQLNLPVLIATTAMLLIHMQAQGVGRAVFASRDGRNLKAIFDSLRSAAGLASPASEYWYTSRLARTSAQPDYLAYCHRVLADRPVIVDLCGTGASLTKLFDLLGVADAAPDVFFCEFVDNTQQEAALRGAYGLADHSPLQVISLLSTRSFVNNEVLELLNANWEGMVRGVMPVADGHVPVRDEVEFEGAMAELVRAQSAFAREFAANLRTTLHMDALEEISTQSPQLLCALHDAAALVQADIDTLMKTVLPAHRCNEAVVGHDLLRGNG